MYKRKVLRGKTNENDRKENVGKGKEKENDEKENVGEENEIGHGIGVKGVNGYEEWRDLVSFYVAEGKKRVIFASANLEEGKGAKEYQSVKGRAMMMSTMKNAS